MMKYIDTTVVVLCGVLTLYEVANATDSAVPEPFQRFDDNSKYSITYDDLSGLLGNVVVNSGPSTRAITNVPADITGTRMKAKVKRFTANEGNRFFFETFKDNDAGQEFLRSIQKNLEQLPGETPLEKFSRDEQLAYWLNLYNVTVLNEIIAVYPKRTLKRLFMGKNSIFEKKLLMVSGIPLSLNDIQFTILNQNYDNNPLIIYGLYQGIVGGPNIRSSAYNGENVYYTLEENAFEFINSNRGTFTNDEVIFRVSSLYERNKGYFPDFDSDLTSHLMLHIEGKERDALQAASRLKPDINDWTVTDLGGTRHDEIGRSLAHNNAALLDSYRSNRRNIDGSIRAASLEMKREKKDRKEDDVKLEDLERFPVGGASVEEVVTEENQAVE